MAEGSLSLIARSNGPGSKPAVTAVSFIKKGGKRRQPPRQVNAQTKRRVRKALSLALTRQQIQLESPDRLKIRLPRNGRRKLTTYQVPEALQAPKPAADQPVIRSLGRREQVRADTIGTYTRPQMSLEAIPKVSLFATLRRLTVWLGAIRFYTLGNLSDRIHKRDSQERRAIRLRQSFERVGGTFVKIGQQMASRLDLLPLRYCEELTAMLDRYPPFPSEQAIEIIERTTGQPLDTIFSAFDPEPIGSASIAVVYQAVLRESGEPVAVKVRRPGIRELFETDFKVLDILGDLAELLTLIRPGVSQTIRQEFRNSLSSELDFRREARIQEVFAREARKDKISFFSAPAVIPQYSNMEVIIQEFVAGMWLHEVLAGVEQEDAVALERMKALNIDAKLVARRVLFMSNWGIFRSLAFHADPHPANIVVRANSEVVFIDFGATGYFNTPRRNIYHRMQESYRSNNIWEMAKMGIAMSEPLPAVDVNEATRDIEKNYYDMILAIRSKNSSWYERTTANAWISNLKTIQKHNVGTPQDLLMFARSSLLYDTLAARLHPRINFYKEANRYFDWASRKSKKRGRKAFRQLRRKGLLESIDFQQIERSVGTFNSLLFRMERLFSAPYDFAMLPFMVEKWVHVLMNIFHFVGRSLLVAGIGVVVFSASRLLNGQPLDLAASLSQVISHPAVIGIILLLGLLHARLILFRMGEKTTDT